MQDVPQLPLALFVAVVVGVAVVVEAVDEVPSLEAGVAVDASDVAGVSSVAVAVAAFPPDLKSVAYQPVPLS